MPLSVVLHRLTERIAAFRPGDEVPPVCAERWDERGRSARSPEGPRTALWSVPPPASRNRVETAVCRAHHDTEEGGEPSCVS